MKEPTNYFCIIPAAGIGSRMQQDLPKQYLKIHDRTILEYAIAPFLTHPQVKKIVVVLHPQDEYWSSLPLSSDKKIKTTWGGSKRADSVLAGLQALGTDAQADDWVLIHDAARPCIQVDDINKLMMALSDHPVGGLLAMPMTDTVKQVEPTHQVNKTLDRELLWNAQTPQMFRYAKLLQAYENAINNNQHITDSSSAVELLQAKPMVVTGSRNNIKISYPEDLELIYHLLKDRYL